MFTSINNKYTIAEFSKILVPRDLNVSQRKAEGNQHLANPCDGILKLFYYTYLKKNCHPLLILFHILHNHD
jgi:hypothetical protein